MRNLIHRGMPRTGTNLAERLIYDAFGFWLRHRPNPDEKHAGVSPKTTPADTLLLILIKDPYAWIPSIFKWQVQMGCDGFRADMKHRQVHWSTKAIRKRIDNFNRHYRTWFRYPYERLVMRYEDVIADPDNLIRPLEERLNSKRLKDVQRPQTVVYPGQVDIFPWEGRTVEKPAQFDLSYYTEKRYLKMLSPRITTAITHNVDWKLLDGLYEPLSL